MDIIPNKKSKLLYQRGDLTNEGVIDLRRFSDEKIRKNILAENSNKVVLDVIRKENIIESETGRENIQKPEIKIKKVQIEEKHVFEKQNLPEENSSQLSVKVSDSEKETVLKLSNCDYETSKKRSFCHSLCDGNLKLNSKNKLSANNSINLLELPSLDFFDEEKGLSETIITSDLDESGRNLDILEFKKKIAKEENIKKLVKSSLDSHTRPKSRLRFSLLLSRSFISFVFMTTFMSCFVFSLAFVQKEIEGKGKIMGVGVEALNYLKQAGQSVADNEFSNSFDELEYAKLNFSDAKRMTDDLGFGLAGIINSLPIDTPLSSAKNVTEAGENIALAGENIVRLLDAVSKLDFENFSSSSISDFGEIIENVAVNLKEAEEKINSINSNYIPDEMKAKMDLVQNNLPTLVDNLKNLAEDFEVLTEIIGDKKPQKYLLLFQNNSEMRATGGFIGSYGILDMENGKVENLFIDGIFNPDGRLNEKIVPPMPIQKISAAWSMHDANWFADFPTSAQKVASFYEKTGGPTVDGVITFTPSVIEKILRVIGPVEMVEYNLTLDAENFLSESQRQVEELYDKEENRPKKILSDLVPLIFEKMLDTEKMNEQEKVQRYLDFISIIEESLKEKHIMFYHRNADIENMILKRGWGGQIRNSSGNYLSVVNSNINGYKTDAVVEESINHLTEMSEDGSIINTVKITRKHTGGQSDFDWYNRVNSDYLRVYVPLGSILLEASGHTLQEYKPPIDYEKFSIDQEVKKIEDTIKIDSDSGTQIFEESGKTVFGNWVYVSPGETVEVTYKYELPYRIDFNSFTKPADKYSMLVQKQSGSTGSNFLGTIRIPESRDILWESSESSNQLSKESYFESRLDVDKVYGIVFSRDVLGD